MPAELPMTGVALATKLSARLRAVAYTAKSKSGFLPRGPMRYPPSASSRVEPPERRSQLNTRCPHPRRRSGLARSTRLISLIGFRLSQRGCSERSNSFIRQVDFARYDRRAARLHSNVVRSVPLEKPGAPPGGRATAGELMPWRYKRQATEDRNRTSRSPGSAVRGAQHRQSICGANGATI